jgi:hypothetical protein
MGELKQLLRAFYLPLEQARAMIALRLKTIYLICFLWLIHQIHA